MTIREAADQDFPSMARIRAAEWGTYEYWMERISGYVQGTIDPQKALKPHVVFVAEEDGAVCGLIAGHLTTRHGCQGELEWIDVIAARRRSGVASRLIRVLAEWFDAREAPGVCVNVTAENLPARKLYARHGAVPLMRGACELPGWMVWEDVRAALG